MLKKIIVVILVIAALGAVAASFSRFERSGSSSEESTETDTVKPPVSGGTSFEIDPDYEGTIVYDSRTNAFNLIPCGDAWHVQKIDVDDSSTYDVVWLTNSALLPAVTAAGAEYCFAYTLGSPSPDQSEWIILDSGEDLGQVRTAAIECGQTSIYFYVFTSDESTDVDSIFVNGSLYQNFDFVLLKRD